MSVREYENHIKVKCPKQVIEALNKQWFNEIKLMEMKIAVADRLAKMMGSIRSHLTKDYPLNTILNEITSCGENTAVLKKRKDLKSWKKQVLSSRGFKYTYNCIREDNGNLLNGIIYEIGHPQVQKREIKFQQLSDFLDKYESYGFSSKERMFKQVEKFLDKTNAVHAGVKRAMYMNTTGHNAFDVFLSGATKDGSTTATQALSNDDLIRSYVSLEENKKKSTWQDKKLQSIQKELKYRTGVEVKTTSVTELHAMIKSHSIDTKTAPRVPRFIPFYYLGVPGIEEDVANCRLDKIMQKQKGESTGAIMGNKASDGVDKAENKNYVLYLQCAATCENLSSLKSEWPMDINKYKAGTVYTSKFLEVGKCLVSPEVDRTTRMSGINGEIVVMEDTSKVQVYDQSSGRYSLVSVKTYLDKDELLFNLQPGVKRAAEPRMEEDEEMAGPSGKRTKVHEFDPTSY